MGTVGLFAFLGAKGGCIIDHLGPEHISENYDISDFELNEEDMQKIRDLDRQERYENL